MSKIWSKIVKFIRSEPAILLSLIGALLSLALAFGLKLSTDQVKAVYTVVAALTGVIIRQVVTPTSSS